MISWPGRWRSICSRISIGSTVKWDTDADMKLVFVEAKLPKFRLVGWWSRVRVQAPDRETFGNLNL